MTKILIISFITLLLVLTAVAIFMTHGAKQKMSKIQNSSPTNTEKTNATFTPFTATFSILTNGTKRDLTDSKYHNKSKNVFITSENPSVIKVTEENVTYQDFFDSLPSPMKLDPSCLTTGTGQNFCTNTAKKLIFTRNEEELPGLLSEKIMPGDTILINYTDR